MHSLVLQEVSKRFAKADVLQSISLKVAAGERVAVVGESGSGKTTLLRIIAGLEPLSSGRVRINDLDVTSWPANKRGVGMVFQDYATYPRLSVSENLTVSLVGGGITRDEKEARLREVAQWLKLEDLLKRLPSELSGGQLQRVALGKVLIMRPHLLLLDEPFSQLDVRLAEHMRHWLAECHERFGITQIMVTHDPYDALATVDRIAVLHQGKLSQFASPDEVRKQPNTLFAAQLTSPCGINVIPASLFMAATGPIESYSASGIPGGALDTQAVVAIRPEAIRLKSHDDAAGVIIECRMHGLRDLGIVCIAELTFAGSRLNMRWPVGVRPPCIGDQLTCCIDRHDLFLFSEDVR